MTQAPSSTTGSTTSTTSLQSPTTTSVVPSTQPPITTTTVPRSTTTSVFRTPTGFAGTSIFVGDAELSVLVADTPGLRAQGLSSVDGLPPGIAGMLFVFADASEVNFTMRRTLIPLDIWWFDGQASLIGSTAMEPCVADPCPLYPSPGPIMWALETPLDSVELQMGQTLTVEDPNG